MLENTFVARLVRRLENNMEDNLYRQILNLTKFITQILCYKNFTIAFVVLTAYVLV